MIPVQALLAQLGCQIGILCIPTGPGTPFGSPLLVVADLARIVCCLAGLAVIGLATWLALRQQVAGWLKAGMGAICLFCLSVIGTEVDRLGDTPNYRLLVNLAAVAFALAALWYRRRPVDVDNGDESSGRHAA